ncbi:MAG: GNAT family N-acetyltransferase [Actinomycetota bacterium]|nr:GNAT family N-acetyltransferase [Actinomycetota bacterium]
MTTNSDWSSFPEDLAAIAQDTGPFPQRPFLEAVWHHRTDRDAELHIEATESGIVAVVATGGIVEFAGDSDLTDYHSPLGSEGSRMVVAALRHFTDMPFRLDSLPSETVPPITEALEDAGISATVSLHASTAVLALPDTFDGWLASLSKKQRHEARRKRRKFESEFGEFAIERHTGDAIELFCTMHRLSAAGKGEFMTAPMQDYFTELLNTAGASIHLLVCDDVPRAAAFGFETENGYYYYNSAYDPGAALASPGIVLLSSMIEAQIKRGATFFDFLKGTEQYKYRHGAQARPLFMLEGRTP